CARADRGSSIDFW
nr:immunoglobulin heavy chain junction region [Macaca mulatta]MOX58745.1 immunoglobulin heavy chain junction region [Macaca mulatta]MOX59161.1 immunoglobulin heavy chain junction region [Macaca mulatta]MOX59365.1 immunoglobulin heavy chain junction region [Macaca mulatta]MOX59672.1 immunoglobulin heavy chain junction region [Macaca mulatta]